jgi:hypothetical protein
MFHSYPFTRIFYRCLILLLSICQLSLFSLPARAATVETTKIAENNEEEEQEDDDSEETEKAAEPETEESENDDENEDEDEPSKLIETSASIDFSYSIFQDDNGNEKEADLSGSLEISINPNDALSFHTTIGKRRETALEIDEAYVDWIVRDDETVSLQAGKKFAPFGEFSTAMISSSLPTQLGETDPETIIEGSVELDDTTTLQAYIFKGSSPQTDGVGKHELAYGVAFNYETETITMGAGWLSNLAESDAFEVNDVARKVPAAVLHAEVTSGRFTLIGEHLTATKNFSADDLDEDITEAAKPSANQLEVSVELNNKGTLALAWNTTKEAAEIDLEKETISMAYNHPIRENISGTVEISRSKNYDNDTSKEVIFALSLEHL